MIAYVFPGQGSQFVGMGKDLYNAHPIAKQMFDRADELLEFSLTDIMFDGTDELLKQTKVTQPAIFLHSVILAKVANIVPDMVAGHSLGEFSALVANGVLSFEDGLILVSKRAVAMQKACEFQAGTMAAILGLDDEIVVQICDSISNGNAVAANFNCPGQIVISGTVDGINEACEKMKIAGAKRAIILPVGGAFHSPLMQPAQLELEKAINLTQFNKPSCPIYQNVNAKSWVDVDNIKLNLVAQLTSSVLWSQTVQNMAKDGAIEFVECGPGKVLQGLVGKIVKGVTTRSA